jgi:hypothetical protein
MWAAEVTLKKKLHLSEDYEHPDNILTLPKGTKITVTRGVNQDYCYWGKSLWEIDGSYIDEDSIKIISEN